MRALILIAGAALALSTSACDSNDVEPTLIVENVDEPDLTTLCAKSPGDDRCDGDTRAPHQPRELPDE